MRHTIIIPHRNRNDQLELCLWSILRSADATQCKGLEVLVVEHGSTVCPVAPDDRVRVIVDDRHMPSGTIKTRIGEVKHYRNAFCKSRLLNLGIEHARGEVVTILDADAVVALRWTCCAEVLLHSPRLRRVAYRVRYLDKRMTGVLYGGDRRVLLDHLFAHYDDYDLAWEAYGHPQENKRQSGEPWGNSQFSMRRQDIGGLRYDEGYIGKGLEDIDFNRQVYEKFGDTFRGAIFTHGDAAMFHLRHDYDQERWASNAFQIANADRYSRTL